ncbi:MAG: TPM domain-containing protein [Thermoguttaceae bacterium]|nr:TPM domain-containing protein [Thermoguttaceae bacterium]
MKIASTVSSLLHVVLFAATALLSALTANAELAVPPLTGRVVDAGSVFTPEESAQIESAILRLESATGGQMVVTTLPSLEGLSIEEVGIRLGDTWKIGSKEEDNGAILIIDVQERKMRLEVGIGWEGAINDARAGDVIRGLAPFFRENKYADGAVWAVESVQ